MDKLCKRINNLGWHGCNFKWIEGPLNIEAIKRQGKKKKSAKAMGHNLEKKRKKKKKGKNKRR